MRGRRRRRQLQLAHGPRGAASAGLDVGDAQFIPSPTAGRLPGLVAGQLDGVALHPEDVFLAMKQKPGIHSLIAIADLMPLYMFNAYGARTTGSPRDRALIRDALAAMIEANRPSIARRTRWCRSW